MTEYRYALETLTSPFALPLNPQDIYDHCKVYIYRKVKEPVDITVKFYVPGIGFVDVYDAELKRWLLPPKRIRGGTSILVPWDGRGVFEPRVLKGSNITALVLEFPEMIPNAELWRLEAYRWAQHPCRKIFISSRNMLQLFDENPPEIYLPSGSNLTVYIRGVRWEHVPAFSEMYFYWDLPERAKAVWVQCTIWIGMSFGKGEVRLIKKETGDYLAMKIDLPASTADFYTYKHIAGVDKVLKTEGVDLPYGTPIECALHWWAPAPPPSLRTKGFHQCYRGRSSHGSYEDAMIYPMILKNWGGVDEALDYVDRVMFRLENPDGAVDFGGYIGLHLETPRAFAIYYETEGRRVITP